MKTGEQIISQVMTPFGKRWQDRRCIKTLLHFLPRSMTYGIHYAKFQENILVIALNNSALMAEFYQKRSVIKDMFKKLKAESKICADREIVDFKFLLQQQYIEPIKDKPIFYELSSGNFQNRATKKEIYCAIEEIRAVIKRRTK